MGTSMIYISSAFTPLKLNQYEVTVIDKYYLFNGTSEANASIITHKNSDVFMNYIFGYFKDNQIIQKHSHI